MAGASLHLTNVSVWDGTGSPPRRNISLLVRDGRIERIAPDVSRAAGNDVRTIDGVGRWVIPGLIDLHVHITADPSQPDFMRYMATTPPAEQALVGARNARALLDAGFTTVRDMGGAGYANLSLKRAIAAGHVPGPRLITAGWFLTVPGGHGDVPLHPELQPAVPHVISGPDDARRAVREQVRRGADWIKLLITGGVMTGGTELGASLWEDDEIQAATLMARRLGRRVAAHCHGADGIVAAATAGVQTIEHCTMADSRAVEAMARSGSALVATFCAAAGVVREAKAGRLQPAVATQALAIEHSHAQAFALAREAGVLTPCGSDTGVPGTAFGQNAQELVHLHAHGLTCEEALLAATRDAAAVLEWSDRIGTLEPGKQADLLLIDADPLQTVEALADLTRIHLVVKDGEVVTDRRPDR